MENYTEQTTQFINHSGGAVGSDEYWGEVGKKYGVVSRHYWHGKQTPHGNTEISEEDFQEGVSKVMLANETLHRKPDKYMDLLARNWCQVKNCDEVFAVGHIKNGIVDGGTGWAVQMAIDAGKTVNLYDQYRKEWLIHDTDGWRFLESAPTLTKNFAGIGTRNINSYGKAAIDEVYRNTFDGVIE